MNQGFNVRMKHLTFATRSNSDLIDDNYKIWLKSPETLNSDWRAFFEGFELAKDVTLDEKASVAPTAENSILTAINLYRELGHTQADINPLFQSEKNPALSLKQIGFTEADLDKEFNTGDFLGGLTMKGREIFDRLEQTYCGPIGVEYMHITDSAKRAWLQSHMESIANQPQFSKEKCIHILKKVEAAEIFEKFLHTRYVGQKRFSLQGGECVIAGLDAVFEKSPAAGVKEIVIGMAHRGRLNVLANIVGKSYNFIFREFSPNYIPDSIYGDGDVKYHLGYDNVRKTQSGQDVVVSLAANPSHLEAVNPVVLGKVRARQRLHSNIDRSKVVPILIHGDAAVIGQGVVSECFNLARLAGYTTGGTLHFIINNQIGFTTNPAEGRSSRYCSDVAKIIEVPIFHVNGDDPLALAYVSELALQYRQQFADDVVIDMYCYRKLGHNEADEPLFTQPVLYKKIASHTLVSQILSKRLLRDGVVTEDVLSEIITEFEKVLENAFEVTAAAQADRSPTKKTAKPILAAQPPYSFAPVKTAVSSKDLEKVGKAITTVPKSFNANPKILRQLEAKWKALDEGNGIDWGFAEGLAFGTLLNEGTPIRLSGQDVERGTFSHRHAILYDADTQEQYAPLRHIDKDQAIFCVHNSPLSEASVLSFDYGYSLDYSQMLCLWEAQFGDFCNGAQVIIDQFIVSGESKWQRLSSIVLLLPHGYEGQGPEHSSARLERFLQLCAEENIQVCNVTTPAQYFHMLRRQKKMIVMKPMVLMSPKSLLRHKDCVSKVEDFTKDHFHCIMDDPLNIKKAERLILCSGKVYYDLSAYREAQQINNTAIVRIEQLYPLDKATLISLFEKYKSAGKIVWCQEEPQNMGAWNYLLPTLYKHVGVDKLLYAGRSAAASPATGALAIHKVEQEALVEDAFLK